MLPFYGMVLALSIAIVDGHEMSLETALVRNANQSTDALRYCRSAALGWLSHADPETGMPLHSAYCIPDIGVESGDRGGLGGGPFLAIVGQVCGLYHLERAASHILEQEQRVFTSSTAPVDVSGYVVDGLMSIVDWSGPGPLLDRVEEWVNVAYERASWGGDEVCGRLMQVMSRLYWQTGDSRYRERCFALADRFLLERPLFEQETMLFCDHGAAIIGGLSEVYVIAAREEPERWKGYRMPMHALLNVILDKGVNADGMLPGEFNLSTGEANRASICDEWGSVYNAFWTVAEMDDHEEFREVVRHVLRHIHKYLGLDWREGSVNGYANSIQGAVNLLNRAPVSIAFGWVEETMWHIYAKQREDGLVEGGHGDFYSVRAAMMYALWKTSGVSVRPWREDVRVGAVCDESGTLHVLIECDREWRGTFHIDRPRHREYHKLPVDYPRNGQFPEWYVVERAAEYRLSVNGTSTRVVRGEELWSFPLTLSPGQRLRLEITPVETGAAVASPEGPTYRRLGYTARDAEAALLWQQSTRSELARLLRLELDARRRALPAPELERREVAGGDGYKRFDVRIAIEEGDAVPIVLTRPLTGQGVFPAVVCIHGHGSTRDDVYVEGDAYHAFAARLAESNVVTVAVDVGQHFTRRADRTLMGERILDLLRCVDYLETLAEVDGQRIGCAGLSLGGEMAMWLGALDTRIRATVSSGFLTVMNQMERNHCMCWDFDGLRERVDFPDVYALIAPRALMCQNGRREPFSQFNTVLAERAFEQLRRIYEDMEAHEGAQINFHSGGHEMHVPSMMNFLLGRL